MKYNVRNTKTGQFMKRSQNKNTKVTKHKQACQIVPGRLYGYRGAIVRAGQVAQNGMRHVNLHKQLHGFVRDSQLEFISQALVASYLKNT